MPGGISGDIIDTDNSVLLSGDGSGNIDKLGKNFKVYFTPATAVASTQSGTVEEDNGPWFNNAPDTLYIYLGRAISNRIAGGTVKIIDVTVYASADAVDTCITRCDLYKIPLETGVVSLVVAGVGKVPLAGGGNEDRTYTYNATLENGNEYMLILDAIVDGGGDIIVRGFELTYSVV